MGPVQNLKDTEVRDLNPKLNGLGRWVNPWDHNTGESLAPAQPQASSPPTYALCKGPP